MKDFSYFSNFILNNDFSEEKIEEAKKHLSLNHTQLIKESFKFLNNNIGKIENTIFFNEIIPKAVDFIKLLCDKELFNEEEVLTNINRIKKTREALLANANKYSNDIWLNAANKLDEIILYKKIDVEDLKKLIIALIDRKEDINIIKKFLKTNKAVILQEKNELFEYAFNHSLISLQKNSPSIYYYISLLKIFYSSKIDKTEYVNKLINLFNSIGDDQNEYVMEIYNILYGIRRSLKPEEVLDKYGIITDLKESSIILPNKKTSNELIFAVDSDNTHVRDDAISIKKSGNKYIVGIHITDPTVSFNMDSLLYLQAQNNFKNIYLANGNTSIFPSSIEKQFSLDKNKIRNTISLYAILNDSGELIDYYVKPNTIKVANTFDYSECDRILIDKNNTELYPIFNDFLYVASALESRNKKKKEYWEKKNLDKNMTEFNHKSDLIVRELMILYNYLIAIIMFNNGSPYIYRTQDNSYLDELIKKLNIEIDYEIKKIINSVYLVSKYSDIPKFHNGLKLPIYSQSTCPERRFPDLYNEFLIHHFLFKDKFFNYNEETFKRIIDYCNQRSSDLSLMRSEYNRALKLLKRN